MKIEDKRGISNEKRISPVTFPLFSPAYHASPVFEIVACVYVCTVPDESIRTPLKREQLFSNRLSLCDELKALVY